jgi:uncharacterized protein (TIGR03437 family)
MKQIAGLIIFAIVLVAPSAGQPQIAANGVLNAASNAVVRWPDSSIAQGSIFSIYGTDLGPASSPTPAYPLGTTLGGVSVQITSGNTTLNAIPIFAGPTQINAILPDSTSIGAATLTVTYNGQTSNAVSFQVIAHSFGIFTVRGDGSGAGVITGPNYQLYPVSSPARPGDAATIWGTGIGASPSDDGSAPPQRIDMPDLSLSVYVGTQAATVTYRGRGGFTGEDQINFVVPPGITGCYVPVAVEIGNIVSNFATMPIAPAGQPCPDPTPPVPALGPYSPRGYFPPTGIIMLTRNTTIGAAITTADSGEALFNSPQILAFPYFPPFVGNPYSLPPGACIGGIVVEGTFSILSGPPLEAGPAIAITGPNGSRQLIPSAGLYSAQLGGAATVQPLYLDSGAYTASAPGGTNAMSVLNIGPFSQNFTIPQPLNWTNQASINTVDRSAGLEVTWTGGDPNGTVQITGNFASFICNAKTSDQHFTIPAFVLLSLAPSPAGSPEDLTLSATTATPFTASGISSGTINSVVTIQKNVTYQ